MAEGMPRSKTGTNALRAVKRRIENDHRSDVLDRNACLAADRPKIMRRARCHSSESQREQFKEL